MSRSNESPREHKSLLPFHLCALVAVTTWGASFISTKVLLQNGLNAVEIYLYRFLIAYLLTLILCPRPLMSHSWRDELKFALCGICGGSVYFIAENTAVQYTLVSNVSLIVATAPLITTLIVAMLYKGEKLSKGLLIGSTIAFLGVACVIFNSSFVLSIKPFGDILSLLAAVCWAIYSLLLRSVSALYSAWFITRKTFFYGVVTALPFLFLESEFAPLSSFTRPEVYGNLLFLGMVCSMAAYLLWGLAVGKLGALKANNYLYLSPLATLALSAWLLDEQVSIIGYTGCALILIGLIVGERLGNNQPGSEPPK